MNNFIGLHATKNIIVDSNGNQINASPYLLASLMKHNDYNPVLYDLDCFAACLLHDINITKEQDKELLKSGRLNLEGYKIVYFPKSFLAISYGQWHNHPEVIFTNMNQDGYLKPVYTKDNSVEDAIKKAIEAKDVATEVSKAFKYFNLPEDNISSPIKAFLKQHELNWPTVDDCNEDAAELAWKAIKGHWFETMTIGNFKDAYMYDINGSYAYELSRMPDIRLGHFIESNVMPANAMLGIAEGILETDAEFHPFMARIDSNNYTPTGKYPTTLGMKAIELLKLCKLGTFEIGIGYWWIPTQPMQYCYKPRMEWLWDKKRQAGNATEKAIATRIYSALWGIQGQYFQDSNSFGQHFNPFIHYLVEENSRLHVADACLGNNIIPLAVVGDGFITDKYLSIDTTHSRLGFWKLSKQGKCLIAGNGSIAFESDKPANGLALHYNTLIKQMQDKPNSSTYPRNKYSPVTLALALQTDFNKLGTIQEVERSLVIGYNYERMFLDRPTTGSGLLNGKVYNSSPWDYSILTTKGEVL